MRVTSILLLAGLTLLGGCRRARPVLVPEMSPPLIQEEICSWNGTIAGNVLFPCTDGVGWVDASGRIVVCDVDKRSVSEIQTIPFAVSTPPFIQGDFLLLQDKISDRMLVYDLIEKRVKFEALHMGAEEVLGVGPEGLVCLDDGRPTVRLWDSPTHAHSAPEKDERFFNCRFSLERIVILGKNRLLLFDTKTRRFQSIPLPRPAASPFACDGRNIYYGSTRRTLVKVSLPEGTMRWEVKLGRMAERRPLLFSDSIVVCPNDQNVVQVNRRGTILWWQALGSTAKFDLVPMNAHLAAFLMNHAIRFLDPALRKVTLFQGNGHPIGAPAAFGDDLFFLTHDGAAAHVQRVGSRFGIEIELEPAEARWPNSSIRFTPHFYNLPDPSWEYAIHDAAGKQVFGKSMTTADPGTLVWVPLRPGKYVIRVRAESLNREWKSETSVDVLDPLQTIRMFFPIPQKGTETP